MKKLMLLATAGLLIAGVSFANADKGKKKKCAKGKSCCTKSAKSCDKDAKSCSKDKAKTAKI